MKIHPFLLVTTVLLISTLVLFTDEYSNRFFFKSQTKILNGESSIQESAKLEKEFWVKRIAVVGGDESYREFKNKYGELDVNSQHIKVHSFGEALYERLNVNGLGVCDDLFAFGCYHGFFGSAIFAEGIESLSKFDQACIEKFEKKYLPCQHGLGHGLLVYYGSERLREALDKCRDLTWQNLGGCSSGVFMEFNFNTVNHKRAETRQLDSKGPYFPCDNIPTDFQPACYFELPQWWQSVIKADYEKIGSLCFSLESKNIKDSCFKGVGNYTVPFSNYDVDLTIATCSKMPDLKSTINCSEGASWIFLTKKDGVLSATKICRSLPKFYEDACVEKLKMNGFYGDRN